MATIAINVSKNLREKLGEEGTQEFISVLNQINSAQLEEMERLNGRLFEKFQQALAHTRDLLSSQIERVEERLRSEMAMLRGEFKNEISELRGEFEKQIAQRHTDLLKWMFIFWATATLTIIAGYFIRSLAPPP
jgi:hypothetical protein